MNKLKYFTLLGLLSFNIQLIRMPVPAPRPGINPEIQQYVDRFVALGKKFKGESFVLKWINVDIGEVKDPWEKAAIGDDVVGWCKPFFVPMEIMLQTQEWNAASDIEREQLVFHELGHCILGLQHDDTVSNNRPTSIMYPYLLDKRVYLQYRDEYIKELFTKRKP